VTELLLVGAGYTGTRYIAAARRIGARVRLVETEPHVQRLRERVDEVYPAPSAADEAWAQPVYAAVRERAPDGVLAFNEPQVLAAALVQDRLGLPGPSLHAAVVSRNKALQRACFGARGVPQPEYLLTDDLDAAAGWAGARFPIVVKPPGGAGSAGVELVADAAGYRRMAARRRGDGSLLLETAVPGPEFSWEALLHRGAVVFGNLTRKQTTGPPHFVEVGHRVGQAFDDPALAARVDGFLREVVAALAVATGIVHAEFRLPPAGPVLIEIAVRTPGDHIMDALSLAYGLDMYEQVVRLALGTQPRLPSPCRPTACAAVHMLVGPPGRLAGLDGEQAVRAHPAVVRVELRREIGEMVPPLRSSDDRVGHVLMCAPSPAELDDAESFVRRRLRVVTHAPAEVRR
jgi:biotin carboxylase